MYEREWLDGPTGTGSLRCVIDEYVEACVCDFTYTYKQCQPHTAGSQRRGQQHNVFPHRREVTLYQVELNGGMRIFDAAKFAWPKVNNQSGQCNVSGLKFFVSGLKTCPYKWYGNGK